MTLAIIAAVALSSTAHAEEQPSVEQPTVEQAAELPRTAVELSVSDESLGMRFRRRAKDPRDGTFVGSVGSTIALGAHSLRVEIGRDYRLDQRDGLELCIGSRLAWDGTFREGQTASALTAAWPLVLRSTRDSGFTVSIGAGPALAWQLSGEREAMVSHTQRAKLPGVDVEVLGAELGLATELSLGFAF